MVLDLISKPSALFEKRCMEEIKVQLFNFSRSYLKMCLLTSLN